MTAARYTKMQAREGYPRNWQMDLFNPSSRPGFCCYSLLCGYCASYQLRKQTLYGDMSRYVCCGGVCPCSGRFGEEKCPELCLGMEVFCCFAQSVASTRFMIQDELQIHNTSCDTCIITTMIVAQYLACICSIAACLTGSQEINDAAQLLDCVADVLWCSVCSCIQTQHKVELDARDSARAGGGMPAAMQAPAPQQIQMGGGYPQPGGQPGAYPQAPAYPAPAQGVPMGYPQQPTQMYR
ncbi:MAG: hypothetical protein J3K34DRAFT_410720 [Monoraphidium minutum]|nr:MAG: hypothetical protein J3K34DRAFT_410720 [Monoraphidium minutum]